MYILKITLKSVKKINKLNKTLLKLKNINNFKKIKINGVFKIKKKKKIFTVLRSPHVNKKSREHFIYENYNQKIKIESDNIFQLLNFLIILKKKISQNLIIETKIIKNNKIICL